MQSKSHEMGMLLVWCRINSLTYNCRVLMLSTSENRRSHPVVPRGTSGAGQMGRGTTRPASIGSARPDYLQSCPGAVEQRYCTYPTHLATYCAALAATLSGASAAGARKGCASSGAYSPDFSPQGASRDPRHPAHHAARRHPLERAKYGPGSGAEQRHHSPNLEAAPSETALNPDLQAQPRQAFRRETPRRGGTVSESARQSPGALRRREKSNSGPRPHSAALAPQAGSSGPANARLQTQWHDELVRCAEHAGWDGHWRLHAAASPSRIYPFPAADQRQDTTRSGLASDRRQLAFHSHFQLLAEHGGALVPRDYRQTHPSRLLPERPGFDRRYQPVHPNPQSESQGFRLERICRTNYGQNRQM